MGPHLVIKSNRLGQVQTKAVKGDDAQLINHKHNLEILQLVEIATAILCIWCT